jgi:predicted metal-dependent phosphoesterase TrpH
MNDAFRRWLHDGGPADVAGRHIGLAEALALGRAVGARMSLAHPHMHGDRAAAMLRKHRGDGLDGLEAIYGQYDRPQRERWLRLAGDLGLTVTAGSDYHGPGTPQVSAPVVELDDERARRLRDWLGR